MSLCVCEGVRVGLKWLLCDQVEDVVELWLFLLLKLIPESLAATIVQYQGIFFPWLYRLYPVYFIIGHEHCVMCTLPLLRTFSLLLLWQRGTD